MKTPLTFPPTPSGLPLYLSPVDPRHYVLLLLWLLFRPSYLKHYLYQVNPELYRQRGRALIHTLLMPAYRNLYLMTPILSFFLTVIIAKLTSLIQGISPDWFGLIFGVAIGVTIGVIIGTTFGMMFGIAFGVMFGVTTGLTFGVVVGVASSLEFDVTVGMVIGLMGGIGCSLIGGVALGGGFGVTGSVVVGLAIGLISTISSDLISSIAIGLMVGIGGTRLPFYLVEWPRAWLLAQRQRLENHPALCDELNVWPLPGTIRLLKPILEIDFPAGLTLVTQVVRNPFQGWIVQRVLDAFLATHSDPLTILYYLAHTPTLANYFIPPVTKDQFQDWPSIRFLLLGEISHTFVEGTEQVAWLLTQRLRQWRPTLISSFSAMLYELLRYEAVLEKSALNEIKLADSYEEVWNGIRTYPHGSEIADSFVVINYSLQAEHLTDLVILRSLPNFRNLLDLGNESSFLRPAVVEAVRALGDISAQVTLIIDPAISAVSQQMLALHRATALLEELASYIEREVLPPEQVLLVRVVRHWQLLVTEERGRLGQAALQAMDPASRRGTQIENPRATIWKRPTMPFDNPYIAGDPVYPPLLVGRKDIFDRIDAVWSAKANPDSIILYGHRRMGKSSILRNLKQVARPGSLIVYADMAGETSFVESTVDLLQSLADRLYAEAHRAYPKAVLSKPSDAYNSPARAQREFSRLAEQVRDVLQEQTIILALDEFEAIERAVEQGRVSREIYGFLRAKTQEPWLTLLFGGLHTLDEMSRDYQQPFYGSYENIQVSYLAPEPASRLITNPTKNFEINYEPAAVGRIITVTGGQPYLLQQVCRDALDQLNYELFDLRRQRDIRITLTDVEVVLSDTFFRRGTVYFDGVWSQANQPEQQALLRVAAQRDEPWSLAELTGATGLQEERLSRLLRWAERQDILAKMDGTEPVWGFYVPLMREWLRRRG